MYIHKTVLFLVVLIPCFMLVSCTCGVNITQVPRSSWQATASDTYTIFDITVANSEDSPVLSLVWTTQNTLVQYWNIAFTLSGFSAPSHVLAVGGLAPGKSFGWGYIMTNTSTPATFILQNIACSEQPAILQPTTPPPPPPTTTPSTQAPTQTAATPKPATTAPKSATQAPTQTAATPKPATTAPKLATTAPKSATQPPTKPAVGATSAPATSSSSSNLWVNVSASLAYPAATPRTPQYHGSAPSDGFCTGTPKMYKGKLCATTTRYWDGTTGACGCGTGDKNPLPFQWNKYTAAASPTIFGYTGWCGRGCGKCFNLTTTGYSPNGRGATPGQSIVTMVTNRCPPQDPWCSEGLSSYNYLGHFDLMDYNMAGLITHLGWDNAEVTFEQVPCTGQTENAAAPSEYGQCQCK